MDDTEFYAQSPRDRNYGRYLWSHLSLYWYFREAKKNVSPRVGAIVVVCAALFYPVWGVLTLAMIGGYLVLMLLFLPVRIWVKENKKGYYADPPSDG